MRHFSRGPLLRREGSNCFPSFGLSDKDSDCLAHNSIRIDWVNEGIVGTFIKRTSNLLSLGHLGEGERKSILPKVPTEATYTMVGLLTLLPKEKRMDGGQAEPKRMSDKGSRELADGLEKEVSSCGRGISPGSVSLSFSTNVWKEKLQGKIPGFCCQLSRLRWDPVNRQLG